MEFFASCNINDILLILQRVSDQKWTDNVGLLDSILEGILSNNTLENYLYILGAQNGVIVDNGVSISVEEYLNTMVFNIGINQGRDILLHYLVIYTDPYYISTLLRDRYPLKYLIILLDKQIADMGLHQVVNVLQLTDLDSENVTPLVDILIDHYYMTPLEIFNAQYGTVTILDRLVQRGLPLQLVRKLMLEQPNNTDVIHWYNEYMSVSDV